MGVSTVIEWNYRWWFHDKDIYSIIDTVSVVLKLVTYAVNFAAASSSHELEKNTQMTYLMNKESTHI